MSDDHFLLPIYPLHLPLNDKFETPREQLESFLDKLNRNFIGRYYSWNLLNTVGNKMVQRGIAWYALGRTLTSTFADFRLDNAAPSWYNNGKEKP